MTPTQFANMIPKLTQTVYLWSYTNRYLNDRKFIELLEPISEYKEALVAVHNFLRTHKTNAKYNVQKRLLHKDFSTKRISAFNKREAEYWDGKLTDRFCDKCRKIVGPMSNCPVCNELTYSTFTTIRLPRKHQDQKWAKLLSYYKNENRLK